MVSTEMNSRLNELVAALQAEHDAYGQRNGWISSDKVTWKERAKFCAIDIGSYGAFLVDKQNGELFNIKAYGVADRNKKIKADIGNIFTVDGAVLYSKRYNYLR